jgi:hypothetical protein
MNERVSAIRYSAHNNVGEEEKSSPHENNNDENMSEAISVTLTQTGKHTVSMKMAVFWVVAS